MDQTELLHFRWEDRRSHIFVDNVDPFQVSQISSYMRIVLNPDVGYFHLL